MFFGDFAGFYETKKISYTVLDEKMTVTHINKKYLSPAFGDFSLFSFYGYFTHSEWFLDAEIFLLKEQGNQTRLPCSIFHTQVWVQQGTAQYYQWLSAFSGITSKVILWHKTNFCKIFGRSVHRWIGWARHDTENSVELWCCFDLNIGWQSAYFNRQRLKQQLTAGDCEVGVVVLPYLGSDSTAVACRW